MLRRQVTFAMFLALGAAFAIVYLPSLRIGFITDDFHMLCKPRFVPSPEWYRYSPVGLAFWHMLARFQGQPWVVRAVALLLHAVNIALVVILGSRLTRSTLAGANAGLLFFAQRQLHQVVFWNSAAFFYMPMTAALLTGCLLAASPPPSRLWAALRYVVGYPLLAAIAAFSHESGIFFLPAVIGLALLGTPLRERSLKQWTGALLCFVPTAIPPLVLLFIKNRYCFPLEMSLSARTVEASVVHTAAVIYGMITHFTPPWLRLDGKPLLLAGAVVTIVGLAMLGALAWRPFTRQLLGLALAFLLVPFTSRLCTWIQDRFLYMPTALFSVFAVALVVRLGQAFLRRAPAGDRERTAAASRTVSVLAVFAVALAGAFAARESITLVGLRNDWQVVSEQHDRLIDNVIGEMDRRQDSKIEFLHLVNPPILFSETNMLPFHPVLSFPYGLTHGVWLEMCRMRRSTFGNWHAPLLPQIVLSPNAEQTKTLEQLEDDPNQLVIYFDGVSPEPLRTSSATGDR